MFEALTRVLGRDYCNRVWTNWYRKSFYRGILTLAYMRDMLDRHNLRSTYPADANVGFAPSDLTPPKG